MQALENIRTACHRALEEARQHDHWHGTYCKTVDPVSVLQLVGELTAARANEQSDDHTALLNLIRDLTGYIKLATGDKPDPVRDDLLLQARELVTRLDR